MNGEAKIAKQAKQIDIPSWQQKSGDWTGLSDWFGERGSWDGQNSVIKICF